MGTNRLSLVDQIAQLEHTAPLDYDPEGADDTAHNPEDSMGEDGGDTIAGREHYVDVGPSAIRRLHDSVTDPKYEGVRVSRSQLMDYDGPTDEDSVSEDGAASPPHVSENEGGGPENVDEDPPSIGASERERPAKLPPGPETAAAGADDLPANLKKTREEERSKGKAVSRQLAIYDSLLDARIRLQKCVSTANRLPNSAVIPSYLLTEEARTAADNMLQEAMAFSDDLFDLREKLMTTNESVSPPPRKRRRTSEAESDWEEGIVSDSQHAALMDSAFHPYLLSTLQKWSNKILAIAPAALLPSNRTKFSRTASSHLKNAPQLIEETLLDREKLIGRTRTWRGKDDRLARELGKESNAGVDAEGEADVFDDTDFYQQLLRDVIDMRNGNNGVDVDIDWRAGQKQKKARKAVDTKASKGRKLRYEVHEKLQNFMVPVPAPHQWHDEQIDELFASLLGKGFENSLALQPSNDHDGLDTAVEDSAEEARLAEQIEQALKGGFRVFG